jgi:DNA-binding NtrC family response regulator
MDDLGPERGRVDLLDVRSQSMRALFVGGDEPLPAPMLARLALYGIDVDRAATVEAALEMMSRRCADYAAVVVGDALGRRGEEFARHVSTVKPRTAVVVWTESASLASASASIVLRKPCTPGRMAATLSRAVEQAWSRPN